MGQGEYKFYKMLQGRSEEN